MVLISALNHSLNHYQRPSVFCRILIRSLKAHSPSMDSHNLVNWANTPIFKLLFIIIYKNKLPQLTTIFLLAVTAADQQQAHESSYKMMLLLIVDSCCSRTADVERLLPLPLPYYCAAAAWILWKLCYNRGYNHSFGSLVVPQVSVTQ